MKKINEANRPLFDSIVEKLADAGVVAGQTFGLPALMANKKAIACLHTNAMAFKLGRDSPAHAEALGLDGAELFDPSAMKRPFKDWVAVPASSSGRWLELAQSALARQSD